MLYSFAVVLWEIWTRQTPFSGSRYKFDSQLERDVLNGTRPAIPDNTPVNLRILIEQCWQEKPKARPRFGDIVLQLQSMVLEVRMPQDATPSRGFSPELATQLNEPYPLGGHRHGIVEMVELRDM